MIERVVSVLRYLALDVADEPELAAAVTQALLSNDSDVEQLRFQISARSIDSWWGLGEFPQM